MSLPGAVRRRVPCFSSFTNDPVNRMAPLLHLFRFLNKSALPWPLQAGGPLHRPRGPARCSSARSPGHTQTNAACVQNLLAGVCRGRLRAALWSLGVVPFVFPWFCLSMAYDLTSCFTRHRSMPP